MRVPRPPSRLITFALLDGVAVAAGLLDDLIGRNPTADVVALAIVLASLVAVLAVIARELAAAATPTEEEGQRRAER